ncbi:MAG: hypothetical protein ABIM44_04940 [candidate division WOR-3 bacterium]
MPLKTERVRVNVSDDSLDQLVEKAKELIDFCAQKKGGMMVEKVGPSDIDVICQYYDEDPIRFESEGQSFIMESNPFSLPPRVDESAVREAKERLDNMLAFIKKCISSGGRVQLTKGMEQGNEFVDIECIKVASQTE